MVCQVFKNGLHFIVPLIKPTRFFVCLFLLLHQSNWYCYQGDGAGTTINWNLYGLTKCDFSWLASDREAKEIPTARSVSNLKRLILQSPASDICVEFYSQKKKKIVYIRILHFKHAYAIKLTFAISLYSVQLKNNNK